MGGIDLSNTEHCYTLEYMVAIHDVIARSNGVITRSTVIFESLL